MKQTGHVEIEMKFRVDDLEPIEAGLAACGFALLRPRAEERSVLWDRGGELRSQGCALRLRRFGGRALLTWKGAQVADPLLKIRPEVETGIEDPEALEGILAALGFAPALTMVKSRAVWTRGALEACLDRTPFGCYVELEGTREEIREAAQALGLREDQVEPRSYAALFAELDGGRP
jgi:adenylate cyclase class 2